MQLSGPTRREQFAAVIAALQPEWRLSRDGWNSNHDSQPVVARDAALFEQFCNAMDFIEWLKRTGETATAAHITSRDLKIYYERVCRRRKSLRYACNGAFILASVAAGLANPGPSDGRELSSSRIMVRSGASS